VRDVELPARGSATGYLTNLPAWGLQEWSSAFGVWRVSFFSAHWSLQLLWPLRSSWLALRSGSPFLLGSSPTSSAGASCSEQFVGAGKQTPSVMPGRRSISGHRSLFLLIWDAVRMTEDDSEGTGVPKRFQKLKFNPLRDVLPIVAVIVGVFLAVRAVAGLAGGGDPLLIYVGSGLAVLGVAVFFINRWQRKRGL